MNDLVVWLIIVAFYAPLHFLVPVLVVLVSADSPAQRRSGLRSAVFNATVSMVVSFAVVIALVWNGEMLSAMVLLFLSMLYPLVRALLLRRQWRRSEDRR